ncbi:MAG: hypothetical protein DRN64_04325, partial [Thaumarchaeota archaeon]
MTYSYSAGEIVQRKINYISIFFAIFMLILATGLTVQAASAEERWEIFYDDGTAEEYYFWGVRRIMTCGPVEEPGRMLAVQFEIPGQHVKIVGVKYYVREAERFKVRLFDSEREPLPIDLEVTPTSSGWVLVDISKYNIVVGERFYVALEYVPGVGVSGTCGLIDAGSRPSLGVDTESPKGRSWAVLEDEWMTSEEWTSKFGVEDGNFMIRALVEEVPYHTIRIDSSPKVSDIIVDGEIINSEDLPVTFDWAEGSTHTIEVANQAKEIERDTRYGFLRWSDGVEEPFRTLTVTGDLELVALYTVQYFLLVTSHYGDVKGGGWYDSGSRAEVSMTQTQVDHGNDTRHVFIGWSGDVISNESSISIMMDSPHSITANWKTQYHLSTAFSIEEIGVPEGRGWWDAGEVVYLATPPVIEIDENSRYKCAGYTIDDEALKSKTEIEILMDKPHKLSWIYYHQFKVKVHSTYGALDVSGNSLGKPVKNEEWFDKNSIVIVKLQPVVKYENSTKRIFSRWTGTISDITPDLKLTLTKPHEIIALWKTQYYVAFEFISPKGDPIYPETSPRLVLTSPEGEEVTDIDYYGSWIDKGRYHVKELTWKEMDVRPSDFSFIDIEGPGVFNVPTLIYSVTVRVNDIFNIPISGAMTKLSANGYETVKYTGPEGITSLYTPIKSYTVQISYLGQSTKMSGDASVTPFIRARIYFSLISLCSILVVIAAALIISIIILRKRLAPTPARRSPITTPERGLNKCPFCGGEIRPDDVFCP